ncbi:hypothetical protein [Pseudonocardia sp. ICBG1293]|uniref:hypothetical protein n=1 Tax=Pseudonocardia sp. ICBG1293 TaxID=2844382 RepID=UPI001CCCC299|nr:hypothetical protein [Pseudonocardia sp. ICBG1293]
MPPDDPTDPVERALSGLRRVVVPAAAGLLLLLAIALGSAAERELGTAAGGDLLAATVLAATTGPGPARVGWTDADGRTHTATVVLRGRADPGRTVGLWLGPDGAPALPEHPTGIRTAGILGAASVLVVGGAVLAAVYAGAGVAARARASARLDREWRAVEAHWRGPAGG